MASTSTGSSRRRATARRSSSAAFVQPPGSARASTWVISAVLDVPIERPQQEHRASGRGPSRPARAARRASSSERGRRASASSATAAAIASPPASAKQRRVVELRRQLDGALEALVGAQRRRPPLLPGERAQGFERLLELGHRNPASSS